MQYTKENGKAENQSRKTPENSWPGFVFFATKSIRKYFSYKFSRNKTYEKVVLFAPSFNEMDWLKKSYPYIT